MDALAERDGAPLVLVVEDDGLLRRLLAELVRAEGLRAAAAGDGEAGLRRARELRPDVVLLDLDLPRLTGAGVVAAMRADPLLRQTPVVLLTGSLGEEGFPPPGSYQQVMRKPFDARTLARALRAAAGRPAVAAAPAPAGRAPGAAGPSHAGPQAAGPAGRR